MRTRLLASIVAIGVLGTPPPALAAPVAGDTWTTWTVAAPSATTVRFGETLDISVDLDSSSGSAPARGTSTLLALQAGSDAWTPVATSAYPGADFIGVEPRMNTSYKVVYTGYDAATAAEDSFAPSESQVFAISVARRITRPRLGFLLKGRVTPAYRTKPIVVRVSASRTRGFTTFRKIATDADGRYRIDLPRRDGTWYWRVTVPGDSRFIATSYLWETKVFH